MVDRNLWADERVSPLSPEAKLLWLYLIVNPQDHYTGIYSLSIAMAAEYLGLGIRRVTELMAEVSGTGMIQWDAGARLVWVCGAFKHQCPAKPGNKFAAGALRWLGTLPRSPLVDAFRTKYGAHLGLGDLRYISDTEPIGNDDGNDRVLSVSASVSVSGSDRRAGEAQTIRDLAVEADGLHKLFTDRLMGSQGLREAKVRVPRHDKILAQLGQGRATEDVRRAALAVLDQVESRDKPAGHWGALWSDKGMIAKELGEWKQAKPAAPTCLTVEDAKAYAAANNRQLPHGWKYCHDGHAIPRPSQWPPELRDQIPDVAESDWYEDLQGNMRAKDREAAE
jgi:hypothetical protein